MTGERHWSSVATATTGFEEEDKAFQVWLDTSPPREWGWWLEETPDGADDELPVEESVLLQELGLSGVISVDLDLFYPSRA